MPQCKHPFMCCIANGSHSSVTYCFSGIFSKCQWALWSFANALVWFEWTHIDGEAELKISGDLRHLDLLVDRLKLFQRVRSFRPARIFDWRASFDSGIIFLTIKCKTTLSLDIGRHDTQQHGSQHITLSITTLSITAVSITLSITIKKTRNSAKRQSGQHSDTQYHCLMT